MKKILLIIIFLVPFLVYAQEDTDSSKEEEKEIEKEKKRKYGTDHMFNIDLGTNNYHDNGKFPDEDNQINGVRPWGSWYVGLNSLQRSHIGGPIFLEWGAGVSWYNFKFQEDNLLITETPTGIDFSLSQEPFDYEKSKLTVSHVNLYLVPVIQFGKKKHSHGSKWHNWEDYDDRGFRIGFGGYAGYRLGSHTKVKYEQPDGDDDKIIKDHDNFYLTNFRYGARLQLGYKGTDIFMNYDINSLFSENRGPDLTAISFGLIF